MELLASQQEFVAYGPSHWVVLALFAVGAVALVVAGRRQTEAQARTFGRAMATVILVVFGIALAYKIFKHDINSSIPLQLCDIAEVMAAYALLSQRHWAFVLTYYWGLLLSSQALLTPDVDGPDFPNYTFLGFFTLHLLVVWSAIYLTWGRGMRPRWSDLRFAVIATLTWVAFTFTFNRIAGTDYGYLNRKPASASILDLFGPWPLYLIVEIALVGFVWVLMTWPWPGNRRRAASLTADEGYEGSSAAGES